MFIKIDIKIELSRSNKQEETLKSEFSVSELMTSKINLKYCSQWVEKLKDCYNFQVR